MASPYFDISDLRGGVNDSDSPFSLADNQVVQALNVDFREGMIATKRKGMTPFSMTNSIFSRDLPNLMTTATGGAVGALGATVSLGAGTNEDGTGTANHLLVVVVSTKPNTDVTAVNYGGTALTQVSQLAFGTAGRLELWTLNNPSLSALNVNVTLAGAADCSVVAQRWSRVDVALGIQDFASFSGNAGRLFQAVAENAQYMAMGAVAIGNTTTITFNTPGSFSNVNVANGTTLLNSGQFVGTKPISQYDWVFAAVVDAIMFTWAFKGRAFAAGTSFTRIITLMRHQPTNILADDELWALDNFGRLDRYLQSGGWQTGVPLSNSAAGVFALTGNVGTGMTNGVSLHGKFFIAFDGGQAADILQVWDGTVLRFTGLSQPTAVTVANRAGAGTYAGVRYFRIRTVEQQAGVVVRRSEPSTATSFTPSGANTGATITFPGLLTFINTNGETHWEVEASTDNVLFYRIGTVTLATGTFDDTTALGTPASATYASFPLSENIGEYTRPLAARHVCVDGDRLLSAGDNFIPINDSRVQWSALRADNGVGNDERVPITSRFFTDVDALRGGAITYMSSGSSGAVYVFKLQQIHKLIRTGTSNKAYDTVIESEQRGCLRRAGTNGMDEAGLPAVYFTDPNVGLCRFGVRGVEDLSQTRRLFVQRFNKAALWFRPLFYNKHWLLWDAICLDAGTVPTKVMCFNVRTRSWTDYDGHLATYKSAVVFPNASSELRPYVAPDTLGTALICEADAGVDDDGTKFRGSITTKPYQIGQMYNNFGIIGAALMARCGSASTNIALVRNYGVERKETEAKSIAASGTETSTVVTFDDATISECRVVQFELGDPVAFVGSQLDQTWTLDELAAKYRLEDEIVGS